MYFKNNNMTQLLAVIENPLLMTCICQQLNPADTINLLLISKDKDLLYTLDHIISHKYELHRQNRVHVICTQVLPQIIDLLQTTNYSVTYQTYITRIINELFEYIFENIDVLDESQEDIIEQMLLKLLDVGYLYMNALFYMKRIFNIHVCGELRNPEYEDNYNDDYEDNDDYIEFIIDTKGNKFYI
jgi:hypothetical protein